MPLVMKSGGGTNSDTGKERDRELSSQWDYFGARYYIPGLKLFSSVDPKWGATPGIGSYVYCAANPLKYKDPNGEAVETIWDLLNLAMDIKSAYDNFSAGNIGAGVIDVFAALGDAATVAVPGLPGGIGSAIKGIRAGDKALDAVKAGEKAVELAKAIDKSSEAAKVVEVSGGAMKAASAATKYETHHLLPKQFRSFFENAGLKIDAPEYLMKLEKGEHRLIPNGVHTLSGGDYNKAWKEFIDANPNAGAQEILDQMERMKTEFGL